MTKNRHTKLRFSHDCDDQQTDQQMDIISCRDALAHLKHGLAHCMYNALGKNLYQKGPAAEMCEAEYGKRKFCCRR